MFLLYLLLPQLDPVLNLLVKHRPHCLNFLYVQLFLLFLLLLVEVLAVSLDFTPLISRQFRGQVVYSDVSWLDESLLFLCIQAIFAKNLTDIRMQIVVITIRNALAIVSHNVLIERVIQVRRY